MPIRKGVDISEEDAKLYDEHMAKYSYFDRMQYVFKIKLNSLYGATVNKHFRFFDKRNGESTTATGRSILQHQCAKTNEILTGEYDASGEAILYGDTDSCHHTTMITHNNGNDTIGDLFDNADIVTYDGGKQYAYTEGLQVMSYDGTAPVLLPINWIYRHRVSKPKWMVKDDLGNEVIITSDHSVMVERDGVLMEMKPDQLAVDDVLISMQK